uniref:Thioredoxin domain-containing protein n=1 Tax=viral metagenome TaxID=1070528 RepID=A0A6C0KXY3_9ZZZZ
MTSMVPVEMALYLGLILVGLWVTYRVYVSYVVGKEGFAGSGNYRLVMYYADWCGHCKTAKPEFAKLGSTKTIGGSVVDIVMINPETNPVKGLDVRGYPTIHLYGPKGQLVSEYGGQRTESAFVDFLQKNVE